MSFFMGWAIESGRSWNSPVYPINGLGIQALDRKPQTVELDARMDSGFPAAPVAGISLQLPTTVISSYNSWQP
jgi:hypothetical protein